ncbi:MAG: pantoate--beta-alanine ligase [Saprospiraceae bacterium]|nr:pantoate--beta-alanine ligase [Saprospiraceae bacterium]
MYLFKKNQDLQTYLNQARNQGKQVGFVPTMGALHKGHLSLIEQALQENDLVVCSIFVNPTQFDDKTDLVNYPKPVEKDINLLQQVGCQVLYLPDANEVYPENIKLIDLDLNGLDKTMEGAHRDGHFRGVVQVVHRLLDIVQPNALYMGQKDFQQYTIIKYMIQQLQLTVRLVRVPIMREADGLAMSSRNIRLGKQGRTKAALISTILFEIKERAKEQQDLLKLKQEALLKFQAADMSVDYFEIVDANTLQDLKHWKEAEEIVACTTVRVDGVRLLDNILLKS